MSQYAAEHRTYFESPAGLELLKQLKAEKRQQHYKAEAATSMEAAYAATQRAMGVQQALDIISSMTVKPRQPETTPM